MINTAITVFTILATTLAILMYAPQVIKVYKTKRIDGLSKASFSIIIFGTLMWVIYGSFNRVLASWLTNVTIAMMMFVLIWYLYGGMKSLIIIIPFFIALMSSTIFMFVYKVELSETTATVLAVLAGICTGCGMYPQLYKTIKTKNTENISIIMILLIIVSQMLFLVLWIFMYIDEAKSDMISNMVFTILPTISSFGLLLCKVLIKQKTE